MNGFLRIGISAALGIFVGAAALIVFMNELSLGSTGVLAALFGISSLVSYAAAFGINLSISATSCSKVQPAKVAYASAIPVAFTAGIILLFLLIESWSGAFGFIFNTIRFPFQLSSNWKVSSLVGLIFILFWGNLYGELIGASMVELC